MKNETRSFYEAAVDRAVNRIARSLDDALDLTTLAKAASLSPFHFHRVFRGMVGETPLELHRRLRMERAAWRLLNEASSITNIAFDAGYETHEAFTRAFRDCYGTPPSAFREAVALRDSNCVRPLQPEIAARSGVHFRIGDAEDIVVVFSTGDPIMNVEIKDVPALRLAAVRHIGPYARISEAFAKLGAIAAPASLFAYPKAQMMALYYDDPESTPANELRSDAAITISEDAKLPQGASEARISAGKYACTTFTGPYTELGDCWSRLMGEWLPKSGHRVGDGVSFEVYLNDPTKAPPSELKTELYVPLASRT